MIAILQLRGPRQGRRSSDISVKRERGEWSV